MVYVLNTMTTDSQTDATLFAIALDHHRAGRLDQAEPLYRTLLARHPGTAAGWANLATLLFDGGRAGEAETAAWRALALNPELAPAAHTLGRVLRFQDRPEEAEPIWRRYLALVPDDAEVLTWLGDAVLRQGRGAEAIACYLHALKAAPDHASAWTNLGAALDEAGRLEEAEAAYRRAIALTPDDPATLCNLGALHHRQGLRVEAAAAYRAALALMPESAEARFGLCVAQLPVPPRDETERVTARAAYHHHLAALDLHYQAEPVEVQARAASAVGVRQPFHLAYLGEDEREAQTIHGRLCHRLMSARHPRWAGPKAATSAAAGDGRIRIGLVSGFFAWHSVWTIPLQGWLERLDRSRFTVFAYHTRAGSDPATAEATATADGFIQGPLSTEDWARRITADRLDVLIYPEIGMDPMSARLATLRLAPIQCTSLGHPLTSGLPTMDYYLSSDLMEPANGPAHYTERLIRLPNLGVWYTRPGAARTGATRARFGLPAEAVLYWSCQSLYKYLPAFDLIFPRIAREVDGALFVFLEAPFPAMTAIFRRRLDAAFARFGLNSHQHCRFLPRMGHSDFLAMATLADVFLDNPGWSGFNTTLESIHLGLPVVTLPGNLMRARHAYGVLTRLGLTETIAVSLNDRSYCDFYWSEVR
ncbi:protein O-GlcNAc transferase [uncultured Gammaproteobacteria bacterium]